MEAFALDSKTHGKKQLANQPEVTRPPSNILLNTAKRRKSLHLHTLLMLCLQGEKPEPSRGAQALPWAQTQSGRWDRPADTDSFARGAS